MFQLSKHTLSAPLAAAAIAIAALPCATAGARVNLSRQAPVASTAAISLAAPQVQPVQTGDGGFGWGDAAIGAAGATALMAAGSALVGSRRRHGRHAMTQ